MITLQTCFYPKSLVTDFIKTLTSIYQSSGCTQLACSIVYCHHYDMAATACCSGSNTDQFHVHILLFILACCVLYSLILPLYAPYLIRFTLAPMKLCGQLQFSSFVYASSAVLVNLADCLTAVYPCSRPLKDQMIHPMIGFGAGCGTWRCWFVLFEKSYLL